MALDWMMFTAAIASDTTLWDALIDQVHAYASSSQSKEPFNVLYDPLNGSSISETARSVPNADCLPSEEQALSWLLMLIYVCIRSPAQGAMFALLALEQVDAIRFMGRTDWLTYHSSRLIRI